jgi:hypothetical protein
VRCHGDGMKAGLGRWEKRVRGQFRLSTARHRPVPRHRGRAKVHQPAGPAGSDPGLRRWPGNGRRQPDEARDPPPPAVQQRQVEHERPQGTRRTCVSHRRRRGCRVAMGPLEDWVPGRGWLRGGDEVGPCAEADLTSGTGKPARDRAGRGARDQTRCTRPWSSSKSTVRCARATTPSRRRPRTTGSSRRSRPRAGSWIRTDSEGAGGGEGPGTVTGSLYSMCFGVVRGSSSRHVALPRVHCHPSSSSLLDSTLGCLGGTLSRSSRVNPNSSRRSALCSFTWRFSWEWL